MKASSVQLSPWRVQIFTRMKSHLFLKIFGITLFMWAFFAAYLYLLKNPVFPVTIMPLSFLDSAVGFKPDTLFLYGSLWFYVTLPAALQATRRDLVYYALAVGTLCAAGLACFLFWPTAVPAEHIDWNRDFGFSILKRVDAAGNACPSLHVATAVFSAAWLNRQLFEVGAPRLVRAFNWAWCVGIAYSTMATKQHVAVDVAAGAIMGMLAASLSLAQPAFLARQNRVPVQTERRQGS